MKDYSKRQYLKYSGAALAALSLGVGGKMATSSEVPVVRNLGSGGVADMGDGLDADAGAVDGPAVDDAQQVRPRSGDVLDYERDEDGNVEFDWEGLSFETRGRDNDVELTVNEGNVTLDLETDNNGRDTEMTLEVSGEYVDLEVTGAGSRNADVEFEAIGTSDSFEDDGNELEYKGDAIQVEYDTESKDLEVRGDVMIEWDTDELEYRDDNIMIEWKRAGNRGHGDFEARLL
jgi:hypothetical protein